MPAAFGAQVTFLNIFPGFTAFHPGLTSVFAPLQLGLLLRKQLPKNPKVSDIKPSNPVLLPEAPVPVFPGIQYSNVSRARPRAVWD
jgi:hypothetical protein